MEKLKQQYNHYLKRYYNGVNYIDEHTDECDKYLTTILDFLNKINNILLEIMQVENVSEKEILEGFIV